MFWFNPIYLIFMASAFLLMLVASMYVKWTYSKWSKVPVDERR